MLRSWKCFACHGRAVGLWTTTSAPNMSQVVPPHSQPTWCIENLLHLNHTLHHFFLCFISAPVDTLGPQHGIPVGVPEGWQFLHPPWLSHLLIPLGLRNPAGFCLGFSKYPLTFICFFFAFLFSAPLKWAYAPRELGTL